MTADTGVIPVGDDQRAIGGDGDVTGAEPAVVAAFQDVDDLGLVACAIGLGDVGADDVRVRAVAVEGLAVEDAWAKRSPS